MTIAEWMVFGAVLLYLLTVAPVKVAGKPTFDNSNPRDAAFYTPGIRVRALGAHINGIETFPFFAAAVLLAEFRSQPQQLIDLLAVAFVAVRLAFVAAYLAKEERLTRCWSQKETRGEGKACWHIPDGDLLRAGNLRPDRRRTGIVVSRYGHGSGVAALSPAPGSAHAVPKLAWPWLSGARFRHGVRQHRMLSAPCMGLVAGHHDLRGERARRRCPACDGARS
jgi:uncharacterized MAPEG superfamily protein